MAWARRCSTAALLGVGALAHPLSAQRVVGTVRESGAGAPIAGAVVWLAAENDSSLRRVLTDVNGHFALLRPRGAVRAHVVRIGFTPRTLALTSDSLLNVELSRIPAQLGSITTEEQRLCPDDGRAGRGFALWEQARAALLANVVARETQAPRLRLLSFERTLGFAGRVTDRTHNSRELVADRSYVAGRSPEAFAVYGYLDESTHQRVLYAPDEATLLSQSFLEHHCLRARDADDAHRGEVGIAFEPVGSTADTLVDVRGVLWLDAVHPALRSLSYSYTGLEPAARASGGDITFTLMGNGLQLVTRWVIRVALMTTELSRSGDVRRLPARDLRFEARANGVREVGGEVASARWPDGTTWESSAARLVGQLVDLEGHPVINAVVWTQGSADTVTTDSTGHFSMPPAASGIHTVMASDSVLALAGIARSYVRVFLGTEANTDVRLQFIPRADLLAHTCKGQRYTAGDGVVFGLVLDASGAPVANTRIELWQRIVSKNVEYFREEISGEAGEDGRFIICGTTAHTVVKVRATKGDMSAEAIVPSSRDEVLYVPLTLRPQP